MALQPFLLLAAYSSKEEKSVNILITQYRNSAKILLI